MEKRKTRGPTRPWVDRPGQAGRPLAHWLKLVGFSRSTFYKLPADSKPRSVTIGKSIIITEQPADYLERIAAAGGAATKHHEERAAV